MRKSRSALRWSSPNAFTNSLSPSAATAKYGVEPRASTLASSRRASGTPTAASPSAIDVTGRTARRTPEQHDDRGADDPPDEHGAHRVERHRCGDEPVERQPEHEDPTEPAASGGSTTAPKR